MSEEDCLSLLRSAIRNEVARRNGTLLTEGDFNSTTGKVAQWLTSDKAKAGIIFMGPLGNGKSTMIRAISALISAFKMYDPYGHQLQVKQSSALAINRLAKDNPDEYYSLCKVPLLAIDDYGQEAPEVLEYGNAIRPLDDLLYMRYDALLPTIISSNLTVDELRERAADRLYDRMREMYEIVVFTNNSYRR